MAKSSADNRNLRQARKAKKDEFYTQLADIEKELKHYKNQFRGKIVYCNCDDPYESNFFKYFAANFNALGLKKLITTSYSGSPIAGQQLPLFEIEGLKEIKPKDAEAHRIEINEVPDFNKDGAIDLKDIEQLLKHTANVCAPLKGNGDFRSEECIELLKQADIVCTNPPFSLFREYVAQLVEYDKKFLIIGNINAITYKEIFKLIKNNKLWLGITMDGRNVWFRVPDDYPINENVANSKIINGEKYLFVKGCVWFTNLDTVKRHEELVLYKKYNPKEYPKYDNYDAIEVSRVSDIPMDYDGVMGVPITFLTQYNPDQFEILWTTDRGGDGMLEDIKLPYTRYDAPVVNGKGIYKRILIKNKKVKK